MTSTASWRTSGARWRTTLRRRRGGADWPVVEPTSTPGTHGSSGNARTCYDGFEGDPDHFDPKIAGWWVAGVCGWIGSGFCPGDGPWIVRDGELVDRRGDLSNAGQGINRQMPHVGDAGQGINRQMPHVGDAGRGAFIEEWFGTLAARLRDVRVLSGDWTRCLTESLTTRHGVTGRIPRPALRRRDRADPRLRRRLRHRLRRRAPLVPSRTATTAASASPSAATRARATTRSSTTAGPPTHGAPQRPYGGGSGKGDENRHRERIYFSPACIDLSYPDLFTIGEEPA